jgi:nucleoside 2-deoxyribosyltransferase
MRQLKYIYVAGPYTLPNPETNVKRAIELADQLLNDGFIPFVPHLCHLWHEHSPKEYSVWTDFDIQWLYRCDALLRFDGISSGADTEVAEAKKLGIPVFYSLEEVKDYSNVRSH